MEGSGDHNWNKNYTIRGTNGYSLYTVSCGYDYFGRRDSHDLSRRVNCSEHRMTPNHDPSASFRNSTRIGRY